ncbi:MAG: FHA domain-containing protein [Candidatus Aureabacteria bacterium]|nr:FHA domain-containing protein [Candidatus Auribacterota bacterium]
MTKKEKDQKSEERKKEEPESMEEKTSPELSENEQAEAEEKAKEESSEEKQDKTMVTAQEEAVVDDSGASQPEGGKEEKTVMLESEGTVLKEIVPGQIDLPEKRGALLVLSGPLTGKKHDITGKAGTEIRIGRDDINDIIVKGEGVSRYHAKFIIEQAGKVKLVDLDSKNGTFVNGKKIKEQVVSGGEKILFGDVACKFEGVAGGGLADKVKQKPLLYGAAAAFVLFLFLAVLIKLGSGGKEPEPKKQIVQQQPVVTQQPVTLKKETPKTTSKDRLEQKLSIAEREYELGNYDDAMQVAKSILEKDPSFDPANKLIKKIKVKRQEEIDKEILKMAKAQYDKNAFGEAKEQLQKIQEGSSYYSEAQKYIKKIDVYPEAEKKYREALKLWQDGKISGVMQNVDAALEMIPEYEKPLELKKKAGEVEALLAKLEMAETEGQIKQIEEIAQKIQDIVKSSNNAIYKLAQEKINKVTFGKYYKANRFYLAGMRLMAEDRYFSALQNFDKARQLFPESRIYDIRYKETLQKINKNMKRFFFAAYVLAERDPAKSKKVLQKILQLGVEDDPYYQKAIRMIEE